MTGMRFPPFLPSADPPPLAYTALAAPADTFELAVQHPVLRLGRAVILDVRPRLLRTVTFAMRHPLFPQLHASQRWGARREPRRDDGRGRRHRRHGHTRRR